VLLALGSHALLPVPSPQAFPVTVVVLLSCSLVAAAVSWQVVERPASELRPAGRSATGRRRPGYTPYEPPAPDRS
jgi:peptidoglycan/LPS O-acetylase OafA/YrhL